MFGPAAVVFALVGVIFSLVELFDPRSPPESPVDKFMDSMRSSFLPSLPRPDPSSNNSKAINFGQQHNLFKLGVESPSKVLLIDGCKDHDKNRENEAELILMRLHHIRTSISFTLKNNPAQLPALLDYMSSDMELLMNKLNSYSRSVSYEI